MAGSRSIARSRALSQTSLNSLNPAAMASPFASATRTIPCATRFVSVLGCMESMMPLHSAIASARLTSNIAVLHHRCDKARWLCERLQFLGDKDSMLRSFQAFKLACILWRVIEGRAFNNSGDRPLVVYGTDNLVYNIY
ncbi:hypothetical protein ACFXTO_002547 [Malus domestica]